MAYAKVLDEMRNYRASLTANDARISDVQITDGYVITQNKNNRFYKPSPTGIQFHGDDSFFKVIMGPFGSGKSVTCCHEILKRTCEMPKCIDGTRRAKWCVVRNTYRMLEISTVQTWLDWFRHFGEVRITQKPPYYFCEYYDDKGKCELEIIFLALDRPGQLESLKSAEFTGAWLNELSGLQESVFQFMKGRINGRYPSKSICPEPYWTGIIADTNPPNTRSWIYRMFEKEKHPEFVMFKQPPGLVKDENGEWVDNLEADNKKNLAPDYYQKMTLGANDEFIKVFCLGEYGSYKDSKIIYPQYNDHIHSADKINYIEGMPIYCGADFGNTPAIVLAHYNPLGKIEVFKEFTSENMNLEELITNQVIPWLNAYCPKWQVKATFGDPSGITNAQSNGVSCFSILEKYHFNPAAGISNDPIVRWDAVKAALNKMSMGSPAIVINRLECFLLREGFLGGYHFKMIAGADGVRYADFADKNENSHIHDALQYLCLGLNGESVLTKDYNNVNLFTKEANWSGRV
jgi:hypothetical protein